LSQCQETKVMTLEVLDVTNPLPEGEGLSVALKYRS
jgi:hypothetical protein